MIDLNLKTKINRVDYTRTIDLIPNFTNVKSFYKKAYYKNYYDKYDILLFTELYSYDTLVLTLCDSVYSLNYEINESLLFSQTTLRHIKEFLKQRYYAHKFIINSKADVIRYNNKNFYKENKEEF